MITKSLFRCIFVFGGLLLHCEALFSQDSLSITIGKKIFVESKILHEKRELLIATPQFYDVNADTYPVLYLLDGDSQFKHVAAMVETLGDNLRIPQMIVVGISNTDRIRDFMPLHSLTGLRGVVDSVEFATSGGGNNFVQFLKEELIPYINSKYRTQPYRILMGHSLGGQLAVYSMQKEPGLFQSFICVSAAFYGKNKATLRSIPSFFKSHPQLRGKMFLGIGEEPLIQSGVDSLLQLLKKSPSSFQWTYKKYPDDDHGSVSHPAIQDGLRFIYKNWWVNMNDPSHVPTYEMMVAHFKKLSMEFGYPITPSEQMMVGLGFLNLEIKKTDAAIEVFLQNVKNFPNSTSAHYCLGLGYLNKNEKELAIKTFEKALVLNPGDKGIEEILKGLK